MNPFIESYFAAMEIRLIQSPAIITYQILRREVTLLDGKLRVKAILSDGGILEFFVYAEEIAGQIHLLKYSFHWQDCQSKLYQRWDNAPHYPTLPNAPHHVHYQDSTVVDVSQIPDLFFVITQIEGALS
jgi:hypothetical protein